MTKSPTGALCTENCFKLGYIIETWGRLTILACRLSWTPFGPRGHTRITRQPPTEMPDVTGVKKTGA